MTLECFNEKLKYVNQNFNKNGGLEAILYRVSSYKQKETYGNLVDEYN